MNIFKKANTKWIVISVAVLLLALVGIGTAFSLISAQTDPIANIFEQGVVSCEIQETFENNVKSDVFVKNTGNTNAYIRVAIVPSWKSESNSFEILSTAPQRDVDYEIVFNESTWAWGEDGYWYYTEPVYPDDVTSVLVEKIIPLGEAPEGYSLSVDILASAVQSMPVKVVESEWGITVKGTTLEP
ncbi:MAG: hypothetical protein IKV53_01515 [Clostridia bacterium]|nr:hypothetical protein [Clostridia bacterium]